MSAPMDEQVERVAKALYLAHSEASMYPECAPNWGDFPEHHGPWIAAARAAIAAMPASDAAEVRNAALREAAERLNKKIRAIQPEMTRRAQRLAEGKKPGFQYAVHRADLDARMSDRDMILALIDQPAPAPVSVAGEMPARIQAWYSDTVEMAHIGTWATTRYPDEAVSYVREEQQPTITEALPLIQSVLDDASLPRVQHDALSQAAGIIERALAGDQP